MSFIQNAIILRVEKRLARSRQKIVQKDKRLRRTLQCIDLAIEHVTTGTRITELAKRNNLTESKIAETLRLRCFWREVGCLKRT